MIKIDHGGIPVCLLSGKQPKKSKYQLPIKYKTVKQVMHEKILKFIKHKYMESVLVFSIISFSWSLKAYLVLEFCAMEQKLGSIILFGCLTLSYQWWILY